MTTVEHIAVLRPLRTSIDLATCVSVITLSEIVDDIVCRRLVKLDQLTRRRRPIPPKLRQVLDGRELGPRSRPDWSTQTAGRGYVRS